MYKRILPHEYICAFSKVLEEVFEKEDVKNQAGDVLIVRQGGDEFAVLMYGNVIDQKFVSDRIDVMNVEIKEVNKTHGNWNMSTASGVVISTEADFENTRAAIKLADERLYENKYKMKHAGVC